MMAYLFLLSDVASLVKDLVLPVATFFLSVAVGLIALQQWIVARYKLRLDLFDRRYRIYEATRTFVSLALNSAVTDSKVAEFKLATSDVDFLFRLEVGDYLKKIR